MDDEFKTNIEEIRTLAKASKKTWLDWLETEDPETFQKIREYNSGLLKKSGDLQKLARKKDIRELREILHEIRSNVAVLCSCANLAENDLPKDQIRKMVLPQHDVIYEVLGQYGKPFEPKESDLHEEIKKAVRGIHTPIEFQLNSLPKKAEMDPGRFYRLVHTLVNNADQHLTENNISSPKIIIRGEKEKGKFVLHISDNGKGMDSTTSKRFYELGYTTRDEAGGTGMGGYIAKHAVEQHNGTIKLETGPKGTHFEIRMPIHQRK